MASILWQREVKSLNEVVNTQDDLDNLLAFINTHITSEAST
jgi:hypothetical protein